MKNVQSLIHFASRGPACFAAKQTQPQLCFSGSFQRKCWMQQVGCWLGNTFLELSGDNPKILFILGRFLQLLLFIQVNFWGCFLHTKCVWFRALYLPISQEFAAQQWGLGLCCRYIQGNGWRNSAFYVHCKIILLLTLHRILPAVRSRWSKICFWGDKGTVLCNTE